MGIIALKCPQCGADIQLDDSREFGFCSFCGTKVMQEKIVIEHKGTVKLDNYEQLENLYNLARRSFRCEEYSSAEAYYKQILLGDSNSAEAAIYSLLSEGHRIRSYKKIPEYLVRLSKCLNSLFELVKHDENYLYFLILVNADVMSVCSDYSHEILVPTYQKFQQLSSASALEERKEISYIYQCLAKTIMLFLRRTELTGLQSSPTEFDNFLRQVESKEIYDIEVNPKEIFDIVVDVTLSLLVMSITIKRNDNWDCSETIADGKEFYDWAVSKGYAEKLPEEFSNKPVSQPSSNSNPTNQETKSGCYVATAVYGSYDCPEVWTLRRFRDNALAKTWYGRAFIRIYYAISPTLVKWFGNADWFKKMWKGKLDRMVADFQNKGIESTPYKDKKW